MRPKLALFCLLAIAAVAAQESNVRCDSGGDCGANQVCELGSIEDGEYEDYESGVCVCFDGFERNSETLECEAIVLPPKMPVLCNEDDDCVGNYERCGFNGIDNSYCVCDFGYVEDNSTRQCIEDKSPNRECYTNEQCGLNQRCHLESGLCVCQLEFTRNSTTGECSRPTVGGRCELSTDCGINQECLYNSDPYGVCACYTGFTLNATSNDCYEVKFYGDYCTATEHCSGNLECNYNADYARQCGCAEGSVLDIASGLCAPFGPESANCVVDAECGSQMLCSAKGRCVCRDDFYWDFGQSECRRLELPEPRNMSCIFDTDCDTTEQCSYVDGWRQVCLCRPTFVFDRNLQRCRSQWELGVENRTCEAWSLSCGESQSCSASATDSGTGVGVCTCSGSLVYDMVTRMCRPPVCEEWCSSSYGDTCQAGQCLRCWQGDFFVCDQFTPDSPPNYIYFYRPAFMPVWSLMFFFIFLAILLFSCAFKCCQLSRARRGRTPVHQVFPSHYQHQQHQHMVYDTAAIIKMPAVAEDLPPTYARSTQQF